MGRSLVILLPETECTIDGDCSPSGVITVTNDGGTVTLTEAYSATMVSSLDRIATEPVTLDNINLNMIDNMFIVNPPKQIQKAVEESSAARSDAATSILDFTDLDTDFGNVNGCVGIQFDTDESAGTGKYRFWIRADGAWYKTEAY